jgi:Phosphotransferase enzyme family
MEIPATPAEISAADLDEVASAAFAGGGVTSVRCTDIGEGTGIFGQIARLDVTVEGGDGSAPASLIAKMACTEPANLEVAQMLGLYEREINMFEHVLDDTPIRTPVCYAAVRGDDGRFLLLLEDMSVDYEVGDQIVGATLDQAERIVESLAAMHARWWQRPELDAMDWLPIPNAPQYVAVVPNIYRAGLPVLETEWADRVPPTAIDVARAVDPLFEELLHRTAGGPATLIHSDTRLDNVFFERSGDGIAMIDFQLALQGRAVADIAYLVGTSMPHELGREHWERLLRHWLSTIGELGVSDYGFDDAVRHYREAAMYYLSGAMSLIGTFDAGNERGAAMAEAYSTRILNHVVDIDARSAL